VADDPFVARRLAPLRLSYVNESARPPYVIYESSRPVDVSALAGAFRASAAAVPAMLAETAACGPCELAGPLTFLGAAVVDNDPALEVETWWRVTSGPVSRNFSLMAHLIRSDGSVVATADGLGIWPMTLAAGDVFVQRHRFALPEDNASLWLRIGAYWLDTLDLWSVAEGRDALLVPLSTTP
jgi:hypothetical protein